MKLLHEDLGFIEFKDVPNQAPYEFRDGIIKPTKDNPSCNYFSKNVKIGLLPDSKGRKTKNFDYVHKTKSSSVKGNIITILSKNSILLSSKNIKSTGWNPDPFNDGVSYPCLSIQNKKQHTKNDTWYGRNVSYTKIIVYKNPEHHFIINFDAFMDHFIISVSE